jgi:hypothetical protein
LPLQASSFHSTVPTPRYGRPRAFFCEEKDSKLGLICLDEPPTARQLEMLDEQNCVYVLMNAERLVDRVDAHFDQDQEKATQ